MLEFADDSGQKLMRPSCRDLFYRGVKRILSGAEKHRWSRWDESPKVLPNLDTCYSSCYLAVPADDTFVSAQRGKNHVGSHEQQNSNVWKCKLGTMDKAYSGYLLSGVGSKFGLSGRLTGDSIVDDDTFSNNSHAKCQRDFVQTKLN
jgi:hypothetical protein